MAKPPSVRDQPTATLGSGAASAPFVDGYLAYLLARASHQISTEFHEEIKAAGLSVMEWRVLASLTNSPALTIGELCDRCLSQQPPVTKLIARMRQRGWVTRTDGRQDRRQTFVELTPDGRAVAAPLLELARGHEHRVLSGISKSSQARLKALLRELIC